MSFLGGGRRRRGSRPTPASPHSSWLLVAQIKCPKVVGKRKRKKKRVVMVEPPNGEMLGVNWLVCWLAPRIHEPSPKCQIAGQLARRPRSRGQVTGAQGARRRGCTVQLAVPEWPEDGRQFLPKSEGAPTRGSSPPRPAWARPRGAPKAWARPRAHVASVLHRLSVAPSPGLRGAPVRPGPDTGSPEEAATQGPPRPGSRRQDAVAAAANENEKGCRFGLLDRTSLLPEMLKIQRTGQSGRGVVCMSRLAPQLRWQSWSLKEKADGHSLMAGRAGGRKPPSRRRGPGGMDAEKRIGEKNRREESKKR